MSFQGCCSSQGLSRDWDGWLRTDFVWPHCRPAGDRRRRIRVRPSRRHGLDVGKTYRNGQYAQMAATILMLLTVSIVVSVGVWDPEKMSR